MSNQTENGHLEWYSEVPRSIIKHTLFGLTVLVVALGGFGWWAFSAPLAAAVISQGSFVATGQNKIVQHLEGGVIEELMVTEGDSVTVGQPIIKLDETAALANERQLFLRRARLGIAVTQSGFQFLFRDIPETAGLFALMKIDGQGPAEIRLDQRPEGAA